VEIYFCYVRPAGQLPIILYQVIFDRFFWPNQLKIQNHFKEFLCLQDSMSWFLLCAGCLHLVAAAPVPGSWQHSRELLLPNPDAAVTRNGVASQICWRCACKCIARGKTGLSTHSSITQSCSSCMQSNCGNLLLPAVTFLALGNGAPDISSSVAAITAGHYELAVSSLLGNCTSHRLKTAACARTRLQGSCG
jgi:hypothetical protein